MSRWGMWARSGLLVALVGLGAGLVSNGPAAAAGKHPTVQFNAPVCVSGLDVSVMGTVNWKSGPVGTVTVSWGDGDTAPSSFPDSHVYANAGTYTVTLTATNSLGSGLATTAVTVGPTSATCDYTVSPQPIAEAGTLPGGQTTQVLVKVTKPSGAVTKTQEPVWMTFTPAPGGGTATACCSGSGHPVALSTTPVLLFTGLDEPTGEVVVTYTLPATPPDPVPD
jgi:hypothetical protein